MTSVSILSSILGIIILLALPACFIVCLIFACIRRTPMWWIFTGLSAAACALIAIPVLFIAARAWKAGSDRAQAIMESRALLTETREAICTEGLVRLDVPAIWVDLTAAIDNEDASLSLGHIERSEFCIVITEPRSDIVEALGETNTFGKFADAIFDKIGENLKKLTTYPTENVKLPGATNAARARIDGSTDDYDLVYITYAVESSNHFHQIMFWTSPSQIDEAMPLFETIAASFSVE